MQVSCALDLCTTQVSYALDQYSSGKLSPGYVLFRFYSVSHHVHHPILFPGTDLGSVLVR